MPEPTNEQETIDLFLSQANPHGWEILHLGSAFPDAVLKHSGRVYKTEFEFRSRNFILHGHDVRACDLIICYIDNWPDCPLPVIELCKPDDLGIAPEYADAATVSKASSLIVASAKRGRKPKKKPSVRFKITLTLDADADADIIEYLHSAPDGEIAKYIAKAMRGGDLSVQTDEEVASEAAMAVIMGVWSFDDE